jgi:hypothetical protein
MFDSWKGTSWELSPGAANFFAGGLASNMFWFTALPMDNIKNRLMVDSPTTPKYKSVWDAYRRTWSETYDPSKGLGANSLARVKNFYKVSKRRLADFVAVFTDHHRALSPSCCGRSRPTRLRWPCGRESCGI